MSTSLVIALVDIAMKPGASMSTRLITTRRTCCEFSKRLDSIREERRAMRRKASKLRQYLPFTASTIAQIERQADDHRRVEREDLRTVLAGIGRSLVMDTEGLDKGLGFDRMCDLLSINTVEREAARNDGLDTLTDLAFAYALEDSVTRRGQEWSDAPLFNACQLATMNFIRKCPEHLLPNPHAPGALFGPKLRPTLRLVGE